MLRFSITAVAALFAVGALQGCVRFQWDKAWREEPITLAAEQTIREGQSTLTDVFERLGAPQIVRPAIQNGMWLIWAWSEEGGWGLRLSVPIRFADVSFSWEEDSDTHEGLAARLDEDLVVREIKRGRLASLLKGAIDPNRERRQKSGVFE